MFTDDQGARHETPEEMSIEHKLDLILDEMRSIRGGFPKNEDGAIDYEGHRKYHEKLIEAADAQTQFWRDLKLDIAKKGAWSMLTILCGLVLLGISAKFGIGVVVK
jgi:hypothetical protein